MKFQVRRETTTTFWKLNGVVGYGKEVLAKNGANFPGAIS
jgi:hypothetical protein